MSRNSKIAKLGLIAGAALMAAPVVAHQTAPAATPTPAPQATPPAATASTAPITDAEVTSFARAALAVDKVNKDTSIAAADKQKKLEEVVTSSGLPPARFNQIVAATGTDAALQKRVQAAVAAEQAASPATATTPAPTASPTPSTSPAPSTTPAPEPTTTPEG